MRYGNFPSRLLPLPLRGIWLRREALLERRPDSFLPVHMLNFYSLRLRATPLLRGLGHRLAMSTAVDTEPQTCAKSEFSVISGFMGYPLKINGQSIVFPTKADAEAFLRDVVLSVANTPSANDASPTPARIRRERVAAASESVATPKETNGFDAMDLAIKFVKAIDAAGPNGLKLKAVMKVLGINDHRAMGNRGRFINREFASAAVLPEMAYTNDHGPDGERVWKPVHTTKKVIELLESVRATRRAQAEARKVA